MDLIEPKLAGQKDKNVRKKYLIYFDEKIIDDKLGKRLVSSPFHSSYL